MKNLQNCRSNQASINFYIFLHLSTVWLFSMFSPIRLRFMKRFCWHSFYLKIVISITYWVSTRDNEEDRHGHCSHRVYTLNHNMHLHFWLVTFLSHPKRTTTVVLLLYFFGYSCFPDLIVLISQKHLVYLGALDWSSNYYATDIILSVFYLSFNITYPVALWEGYFSKPILQIHNLSFIELNLFKVTKLADKTSVQIQSYSNLWRHND